MQNRRPNDSDSIGRTFIPQAVSEAWAALPDQRRHTPSRRDVVTSRPFAGGCGYVVTALRRRIVTRRQQRPADDRHRYRGGGDEERGNHGSLLYFPEPIGSLRGGVIATEAGRAVMIAVTAGNAPPQ